MAARLRIRGVVQGVGFRPFVYRLALRHGLTGWVQNDPGGVTVHLESDSIDAFLRDLHAELPPAAALEAVEVSESVSEGYPDFQIIASEQGGSRVTRISPDLAPCPDCLREMRDPTDPRYRYPYINCTNCGPRYSIILGLPYDRAKTTMRDWPLCAACAAEYADPLNRRYHAQPVACPECGPTYMLGPGRGWQAIEETARLLMAGNIVAVKAIGGYHLMCDARNDAAVGALRERKFRKDKPFALLARNAQVAEQTVYLSQAERELLLSAARPIVLASARLNLPLVAPLGTHLGVMLPSSPLQELLFDAAAPDLLVATSGNRSSEPMVTDDAAALASLSGLADAFLVGERPIARRVDDSVVAVGPLGLSTVRRARGYAPAVTAAFPPSSTPLLAVGPDLKNTVTLVVEGQAVTGSYVGDLEHLDCRKAHAQAIDDLLALYGLTSANCVVAHDLHPGYASTQLALSLPAARHIGVQHHHAHLASVLAEHGQWDRRVLGLILDGTGYGTDGSIWGGEFLVGSLEKGFERVGHLRPAPLIGGDAAARLPAQAAVGFLLEAGLELPAHFPAQARQAAGLLARAIPTTSAGRLFDAAAALLGFTHPQTYEGQAATWLEAQARQARAAHVQPLSFGWDGQTLDWQPALTALLTHSDAPAAAYAFHAGLAQALAQAAEDIGQRLGVSGVVLSGGVWQNQLLTELLAARLPRLLTNHAVPVNDGGVSLGQAALAWASSGAVKSDTDPQVF